MSKKILAIILALVMCLTLLPVTAVAEPVACPVCGGDGNEENCEFCGKTGKIDSDCAIKSFEDLAKLFADGGSGYLDEDIITATAEFTQAVDKDVKLCLNNCVLNFNGKGNIKINKGKSLELYEGMSAPPFHYYDKQEDRTLDNFGLWTLAANQETPTAYSTSGGVITGGTEGGVVVDGGTFTMYGGTICGNSNINNNGGGVLLKQNKPSNSFNMYGGTICGNAAGSNGGVSVLGGSFTMTDGEIRDNVSYDSGGGVYFGGSTFTMTGGSITHNYAYNDFELIGGGICVSGSATLVLGGTARVEGNKRCIGDNEPEDNDVEVENIGKITILDGENAPQEGFRVGLRGWFFDLAGSGQREDIDLAVLNGAKYVNGDYFFANDPDTFEIKAGMGKIINEEGVEQEWKDCLLLVKKSEDNGSSLLDLLRAALVTKLTVCSLVCGVTSFVHLTARIAAAENAYIGAAMRTMWAAAHMAWLTNAWQLWH